MKVSGGQVIALAEQVFEARGLDQGDNEASTDEIDGLVLQAALHLKKEEHGQLEASLHTWQHLFVASKGDLRQTNIRSIQGTTQL